MSVYVCVHACQRESKRERATEKLFMTQNVGGCVCRIASRKTVCMSQRVGRLLCVCVRERDRQTDKAGACAQGEGDNQEEGGGRLLSPSPG